MNYLITTASSIQLTNAEGTTKTISKNQLWYKINKETITFLVLADAQPEGDGTCFFTSRISDLNVNGEVYDKDTIVKALDDIFEPVDIADVYTKRQIDEMLEEYAQVDDLNDFIMVDELPDYLADYQKKLVSGTNIKTVNGQSLLGEGNIVIEGGGGGSSITIDSALSSTSENAVQNKVVKGALDAKADKTEIPDMAGYPTTNQMNTAINSAVAGKADANSVPTKTSQLTNDSGFLTSHQSLDGLFDSVEYDSSAKRINFKDKTNTVVGYVDASDFVKDGMVENVKIENGRLVIDFNTDAGITDISIPLTDIFNADNYYTKSEVDNDFVKKADVPPLSDYYTKTEVNAELAKKADTDNLATVATSGSYNDLSDKPIIPEGAVIDSALSDTSNNAVANRIVKGALDLKADKTEIPEFDYYSETTTVDSKQAYIGTEIFDEQAGINYASAGVELSTSKNGKVGDGYASIAQSHLDDGVQYDKDLSMEGNVVAISSSTTDDTHSSNVKLEVRSSFEKAAENAITMDFKFDGENKGYWKFYLDGDDNPIISTADDRVAMAGELSDYATTSAMNTALAGKQATLVSGTNIKTVNGQSLVGSGNITIEAGSQITVDTEITENSQNPVTSAAIYQMVGNVEQALAQINGTAS